MGHGSPAIELRCDPSSVTGVWDPDRLEQVFSNIIGNAVHHGSPGRPVTVEAHGESEAVVVRVHNEGAPISPELLTQLFNPFRRGNRDSRGTNTEGLGLGLYISREIVAGHGGRVEVESGSAGTTFRVTLPRQAPVSPADGATPA